MLSETMKTEHKIETKNGPMAQVHHYWHIVLRWKWTALIFFFLVVTGATLFSFLITPIYTASGSIWIEDELNILPFEELQTVGAGSNLQSHARLLQSRTLATEIIEQFKLYDNPEFVGMSAELIKSNDPSDPIFRNKLIERFLKSISIGPIDRNSLMDVNFSNQNPSLAAELLNAIFDEYIDMLVRKRFLASEKATEFLDAQIATLRTEIDEREKKLNEYGSEEDILPLTVTETPSITKIAEFNKALTEATLNRINTLNYYNQIKSATLGIISDKTIGSLIQDLRMQYLTLSREYSRKLDTLRPEFPEMRRLKSELDETKDALEKETQSHIKAAYSDYLSALSKEESLQKLLDEQKNLAFNNNSKSILYYSLRSELDNKKSLLEILSKRQSETDVSSQLDGLEAINVWIVDKAIPPLDPVFPKKRKIILIALLIGLMGGVGLAIGIEYLDQTVKTSRDIEVSTGLSILGCIPPVDMGKKSKGIRSEFKRIISLISRGGSRKVLNKKSTQQKSDLKHPEIDDKRHPKNRIELIASSKPQSIQSENYRSIRTSMLISFPPRKIKTILLTSPLASEGKSSTISNLGITLAEVDKQVVIVDSDFRKPNQSQIFGLESGPSLNQFLSSQAYLKNIIMPTQIPNLYIIHCQPVSGSPIGLLTSDRMDNLIANLREVFDYVLIDTPPILAVSDALALGPMVDGVILLARGGHTPKQALKQAKQKLDAHNIKCIGAILNGVNLVEQDGYYAKQYLHYYKSD